MITPNLIPEEADEWIAAADRHGLDKVFLAAPSSTPVAPGRGGSTWRPNAAATANERRARSLCLLRSRNSALIAITNTAKRNTNGSTAPPVAARWALLTRWSRR